MKQANEPRQTYVQLRVFPVVASTLAFVSISFSLELGLIEDDFSVLSSRE